MENQRRRMLAETCCGAGVYAVLFDKLLQQLRDRTAWVLAMGGPEKLAKRKAEGHLNARERIDYLIDRDSFIVIMPVL